MFCDMDSYSDMAMEHPDRARTLSPDRWTSLGQFTFAAGSTASVALSNASTGTVRSSATLFLQS
jgi:hypothetical protein